MKGLLAIGVCLLAALPVRAQAPAKGYPGSSLESLTQLAPPSIHPAVARIVAPGNGSISFGSGTLVYADDRNGLVITNWHVINEATGQISVHFPDGFYSLGTVARVDRDWDLAAIAIRKPNAQPVRLAATPARPGELLTIAGYGSGTYRAASGPCTQYVAPGATFPFEMVEVAVSARQGDSGGPIFNRRGELAGVLFGEGQGRTSGSYCGRVRWFLSNVVPDAAFQSMKVAGDGMKPVPPRPPEGEGRPSEPVSPWPPIVTPPVSLAQTPVVPMATAPSAVVPLQHDEALATTATPASIAAPASATPPPGDAEPLVAEVQNLGWEDLAGHTLGEQIKTVLAIVGGLAIALHAISWLGREKPQAKA